MLLPFKLGGGGPVAGGRQYMPWIHVDDVVGIYLRRDRRPRLARRRQRHRSRAGHQQDVQQGARPRPAPPGRRTDPRRRDPAALRRHGRDRDQGPARVPAHARARLPFQHPTSTRRCAPRLTHQRKRDITASGHHWDDGRSPSGPRPPGPCVDARHRACRRAARQATPPTPRRRLRRALVFAAMTPDHLGRADQPHFSLAIEPPAPRWLRSAARAALPLHDACIEAPAPQAAR